MNVVQAKAIPMSAILAKLGHQPTRERGHEAWYSSPLRDEATPSFHVHTTKNVWFDFGDGTGGNALDFVCAYLRVHGESCGVSDALRWLGQLSYHIAPPRKAALAIAAETTEKSLSVKGTSAIQHKALIRYLELRGIPLDLAKRHLKQVLVSNKRTSKSFVALGLRNEDGGYELRNPFFKGTIAPKTITFIRGSVPKPPSVHVFEGFMDYLSLITRRENQPLDGDAIILNSLACIKKAVPFIQGYGYAMLYTWMDNDVAGDKATQALKAFAANERGLSHRAMNEIYAPHKDLNEWHLHLRTLIQGAKR